MDLIITGKDLTINILVKAARHERLRISFAAQALKNMKKGREFASIVTAKGGPVYGLSVGVGSRKTRRVPTNGHITVKLSRLRRRCSGENTAKRHI